MNDIHIIEDINRLDAFIPQSSQVFVIIDNNLKPFYRYFDRFEKIELCISEREKTLATVEKLSEELLDRGADRRCFLIGVGGGILTDLCGFAASVYKRGVRFGFVPTTLLAQVDASIGGKNGVNFHGYKNILGTITQPEWICQCTGLLRTLPPREFRAGIAEILKTFLLFDPQYYRKAVAYFSALEAYRQQHGTYCESGAFPAGQAGVQTPAEASAEDPQRIFRQEELTEIIRRTCGWKSGVVERDPFEKGERRLLNLGHTFAHAIEKNCTIMHGEAVGIGLVLAARIAARLQLAPDTLAQQLAEDLAKTGLPVESPVPAAQLTQALAKDKKVDGDRIHFILPLAIGRATDHFITLKKLEELSRDLC